MNLKTHDFPSGVKRKIIERTGNRYERCQVDFDEDYKGEFHHIIPVVFGGDYTLENCSLLCPSCHRLAPNIKSKEEILVFTHYFLRFASFKETAEYYNVDNRFDLHIRVAKELEKIKKGL